MLVLHATDKLLKASGKWPAEPENLRVKYPFPGEWYAELLSLKIPIGQVVLFIHQPTWFPVLVPASDIDSAIPLFKETLPLLIKEFGGNEHQKLMKLIFPESDPAIFKFIRKNTFAFIQELSREIRYWFLTADEDFVLIDFLQESLMNYSYYDKVAGKHFTPLERLKSVNQLKYPAVSKIRFKTSTLKA